MEPSTSAPAANQPSVQQNLPKVRPVWRVFKVGFLAVLLIAAACKIDSFLCGYFCRPPVIGFILPVALVGPGYLLYRLLIKLLHWRTVRFWTTLAYVSLIGVLYLAPNVFSSSFFSWQSSYETGFYYWAKAHVVEIPAAVIWAESFQVQAPVEQFSTDRVFVPLNKSLPLSIQEMASQEHDRPTIFYDKREKAMVLSWTAGRLGSWGVTVGRGVGNKEKIYGLKLNDDAYVWKHGE